MPPPVLDLLPPVLDTFGSSSPCAPAQPSVTLPHCVFPACPPARLAGASLVRSRGGLRCGTHEWPALAARLRARLQGAAEPLGMDSGCAQ